MSMMSTRVFPVENWISRLATYLQTQNLGGSWELCIVAGTYTKGLQHNWMLMLAYGRIFCKIYLKTPWMASSGSIIIGLVEQFMGLAVQYNSKPFIATCFRCNTPEELTGLTAVAKKVKVWLWSSTTVFWLWAHCLWGCLKYSLSQQACTLHLLYRLLQHPTKSLPQLYIQEMDCLVAKSSRSVGSQTYYSQCAEGKLPSDRLSTVAQLTSALKGCQQVSSRWQLPIGLWEMNSGCRFAFMVLVQCVSVQVCKSCKVIRFCEDCGPRGWKEGHNTSCYVIVNRQIHSKPPEAIFTEEVNWSFTPCEFLRLPLMHIALCLRQVNMQSVSVPFFAMFTWHIATPIQVGFAEVCRLRGTRESASAALALQMPLKWHEYDAFSISRRTYE